MKAGGVLRVLVAGGVAAGLLFGAAQADGEVHLTRAADPPRPAVGAGSSTLQRASVTCPGADRGGSNNPTDLAASGQQVTLLSASAPSAALPADVHTSTVGVSKDTSLPGRSDAASSGSTVPAAVPRGGTGSLLVSGDQAVRIDMTGGLAPGSTATQYSYDGIRSAHGSSFLQCTAATQNAWILAGGNEPGRLTRLVLSNPGSSAITVAATVVGSAGRDPSSVAGVVVAPEHRTVLTIGRLRAGTDPAIHVASSGGSVSVAAVDVWMDGETPIGEETTGVTASPATIQVMPLVPVLGPAPVIRIVDPGTADAVVQVRATAADGSITTEKVLTVPGGRTGSVPLSGVPAGTYSVQVTSDEPVVAAASVRSTASGTGDITWAAAAAPVRSLTGTGVPTDLGGGSASLGATATSRRARIVINTVDADGAVTSTKRSLTSGVPLEEVLPVARSVWVTVSAGSVRAAVSLRSKDRDGPLLATTTLSPLPVRAQSPSLRPAQG